MGEVQLNLGGCPKVLKDRCTKGRHLVREKRQMGERAAGSNGHRLDRMGRDTVRGDVQHRYGEKSRGPTTLKGAMSYRDKPLK